MANERSSRLMMAKSPYSRPAETEQGKVLLGRSDDTVLKKNISGVSKTLKDYSFNKTMVLKTTRFLHPNTQ